MDKNKKFLLICSIALVLTISFAATIIPENKIDPSPAPTTSPTPSATSPTINPTTAIPQTTTPSPTLPPNNPLDSKITYSQGIEAYGEDYPNQLTNIDWGTIYIQTAKTYNISVLNIGEKPIILYLAVNNWTPGVNGTVTWSYDGKAVAPQELIPITLSLKIESANVTAFNNDIAITSASVTS